MLDVVSDGEERISTRPDAKCASLSEFKDAPLMVVNSIFVLIVASSRITIKSVTSSLPSPETMIEL